MIAITINSPRNCPNYLTDQCLLPIRSLNPENALGILDQCRLLAVHRGVETECWQVIDANAEIVVANDNLADISLVTLALLLQRDTLVVMETSLFKAAVRWATKECHRLQIPMNVDNQRQVRFGYLLFLLKHIFFSF